MSINIATGDLITYHQCATYSLPSSDYHSRLSCSSVTDSICYAITITSGTVDIQVCRINFSSLGQIDVINPDTVHLVYDLAAINDDEVIAAMFDYPSANYFVFYRYNFTGNSLSWSKQSSSLSKFYKSNDTFYNLQKIKKTYYVVLLFLNNRKIINQQYILFMCIHKNTLAK